MTHRLSSKGTRFELLLEAVPDALVGMDQEGVIRFVNRQTESLFGFDRDQVIGKPIETLVPEPLWQVYAQHQTDFFADSRTRSSGLELQLSGLRQDGSEFPINITMSHIDTGDVLLVITAVRDVDRQKRAIKDAQLVTSIVESSDDAILGGALDGIITMWNPAAERLYGYTSKEIIGRSGNLLTPKERAGELDTLIDRIKNGQVVRHLETTLVRKDGTVVPVSINIAPIRDEEGKIVGASAVHRDMTGQRQALEAAQRIAAIVEFSNDAIIGRTIGGTITSWNPAAERLFGYSSGEIVGEDVDLLIPQDRTREMISILAHVSAGQAVNNFETARLRKDGTAITVSLTISPIFDAEGAVVAASVIFRGDLAS